MEVEVSKIVLSKVRPLQGRTFQGCTVLTKVVLTKVILTNVIFTKVVFRHFLQRLNLCICQPSQWGTFFHGLKLADLSISMTSGIAISDWKYQEN